MTVPAVVADVVVDLDVGADVAPFPEEVAVNIYHLVEHRDETSHDDASENHPSLRDANVVVVAAVMDAQEWNPAC